MTGPATWTTTTTATEPADLLHRKNPRLQEHCLDTVVKMVDLYLEEAQKKITPDAADRC